jgi:hypothetical protein
VEATVLVDLPIPVNLADDVDVVIDLMDEDLVELALRLLEELAITDDRITWEEMIDDESVRVVAGSVWPCVDITYKVSTVVKTQSV